MVGVLRVPRVVVSVEAVGTGARLTFAITPRTGHVVTEESGRLLIRFESDILDLSLPQNVPQDLVRGVRVIDPANLLAVDSDRVWGYPSRRACPTRPGGERLVVDLPSRRQTRSRSGGWRPDPLLPCRPDPCWTPGRSRW